MGRPKRKVNSLLRRRNLLAGADRAAASLALDTTFDTSARAVEPTEEPAGADLTPRQVAGQRVIYSYPGLTLPERLLQKISEGEAAGVIFFGENISSETQITSVIAELNRANEDSPVQAPLLLMTDQEGGRVRRLPGEPALSQKQISRASDPVAAARQAGTDAGKNLAGVGMNVNLAPVLDVYRRSGDFIDGYHRSYSMRPDDVAALGKAFITAQQRTGVAATAKHFPGLGAAATGENTDEGPVTLTHPLSQLRDIDEFPYTAAIAAEVKLVMVSWAVYPALDAGRPAGLSSAIVRGELRGRLGFSGVTITDALEAGAIGSSYTTARCAVLAAGAGMDLILCSERAVGQGEEAVSGLTAALEDGTLGPAAFAAAVGRVRTLREWFT